MRTYRDLRAAGVSTRQAATLTGVPRSTATYKPRSSTTLSRPAPANKLSSWEQARVLATLNDPRFVDLPPVQVFAQLLDEDTYYCSISTMYQVLRHNSMVRDRRRLATHPARTVPELVATGPGQVYTWDITKLPGPVRGRYFDCYVMIDIYSRYIIGAHVHNAETGALAEEMMKEVFTIHGTPHVVHADRGTSMTSKTVATLLADLEVLRSHSRPRVSNDNPYSESWFKTLKFAPVFPERFASIGHAREFINDFVDGYNHTHRHSGIGLNTPADVHYGLAAAKAEERAATLDKARACNPERFTTNNDPKVLSIPDAAWINQPAKPDDKTVAA